MKEIITPKQKSREWAFILLLELPPIETKLSIFKEIIGKTQGIRFNIIPPINAKIIA